jgi:hypothetical protein
MYKCKKPLEQQDIELLRKLSTKDFSNFNEQDVREEYITPLLTLLGYEKNTDYEVEREENSKLKKMSIPKNLNLRIGSKNLKLDYKFNIRKKYFWLIEAKTGKNKEISNDDVEQAYLYSLHPDMNCRFFAVCNGWLFNLYDRNRGIFAETDTDLFQPILTLKSEDLNELNFNELYSYLGASEIMFKVKEEILLKDVENMLSAEIYMDRIIEFSQKIDKIINYARNSVWKNIQKNSNCKNSLDKEKNRLEVILSQQSPEGIIDTLFNDLLVTWQLDVACKVIKDKLLPEKKYSAELNNFCKADIFFRHIFLHPIRPVSIDYFYNIVGLLRYLGGDSDLQGIMCSYGNSTNEKIEIGQLLDKYIFDMLDFFENRKDIRALIIIYPIYYRIVKCVLYGVSDESVRIKFALQKMAIDKLFTEEELSTFHNSVGHEFINQSRIDTLSLIKKFIQRAFVDHNHNGIKPLSSAFHSIHTEIIKKEIVDMETFLNMLSEKIDIDKLRSQLPEDEQDEMFPFDNNYKNPWQVLFLYAIRSAKGYAFSNRVKVRMKYMVENYFLPIDEYVSTMHNKKECQNRETCTKQRETWEMEFSINYQDEGEQEKIIAGLKTNW